MPERNEQIEMLLSRRNDADLSEQERQTIEQVITADAALGAMGRQYDKLTQLLEAWRLLPKSIDWTAGRDAIRRQVVEARDSAETDRMLRDHLPAMPAVDWAAARSRFSRAVRDAARQDAVVGRSVRHGRTLRWLARATPLAAAAAIVLAAVWWTEPNTHPQPIESLVQVALAGPSSGGRVVISFDQSHTIQDESNLPVGGRAVAFGPRTAGPATTLDEADVAFFY